MINKKYKWDYELVKYKKINEYNQIDKLRNWETAIGLQEVDGLTPSDYLIDTVKKHIEGTIDIFEVKERIDTYYKVSDDMEYEKKNNHEEADKVSVRIAEILSDNSFSFNPLELLNIHKKLFDNVYNYAGKIRTYNFTKNEWILNNDTVIYASYENIMDLLEYDFKQEKEFIYNEHTLKESIKNLCRFTSNIWQIHPFCEGNTRTVAVFIIKYLRTFGFDINDEVFENNSWYFRNSLVRANYSNYEKNINEDYSYLEKFFYNLLSDSKFELKNRYTHIDYINS